MVPEATWLRTVAVCGGAEIRQSCGNWNAAASEGEIPCYQFATQLGTRPGREGRGPIGHSIFAVIRLNGTRLEQIGKYGSE
jgi:hypothetical protein